jgi:hypothetical protein
LLAGAAGVAAFASLAAGASLLEGLAASFLASTLQVLSLTGSHFAGAAGADATTAGVAGALAGSAAKADTANKVAIKVAINFMIEFPFWLM